jgi:hypothetical protein
MNVEIVREVTLRVVTITVDYRGERVLATLCREYSANNVPVTTGHKMKIGHDAYRLIVQIDNTHADEFLTTLMARANSLQAA